MNANWTVSTANWTVSTALFGCFFYDPYWQFLNLFLILLVCRVFLNPQDMKVLEAKVADISDSCTTACHSQL